MKNNEGILNPEVPIVMEHFQPVLPEIRFFPEGNAGFTLKQEKITVIEG